MLVRGMNCSRPYYTFHVIFLTFSFFGEDKSFWKQLCLANTIWKMEDFEYQIQMRDIWKWCMEASGNDFFSAYILLSALFIYLFIPEILISFLLWGWQYLISFFVCLLSQILAHLLEYLTWHFLLYLTLVFHPYQEEQWNRILICCMESGLLMLRLFLPEHLYPLIMFPGRSWQYVHTGARCKATRSWTDLRRTDEQCPRWSWSFHNTGQLLWSSSICCWKFCFYASLPCFLNVCWWVSFKLSSNIVDLLFSLIS